MRSRLTRKVSLLAVILALISSGIFFGLATPAGAVTGDEIQNWNTHGAICLGITGGQTDSPAIVWDCNTHPDQLWHQGSEYGSTGYYQLKNNDNQCLGTFGGSAMEGAQVVGWTCYPGHKDQYWKWDYSRNCSIDYLTYNTLDNLNSPYVLSVSANSSEPGTTVIIWRYQGVCNNQFWDYL